MNWMLSIWVAAALLALCRGENTVHEANSLSASGYHICVHNEMRNVTFLTIHKVPYTVTKPCGGWLLWKTCTATLYRMTHQTEYKTVMEQVIRCCDGYVQVGRYCALSVNRSEDFTAKPGSCPTANGSHPAFEDCESDTDCPGWKKCCQGSDRSFCINPASSANYSENGGYHFNATVTVKIDYETLMSTDTALANHMRLLQAMVTGALQADVSVYYLSSWPVHPYRTATSLLIGCKFTLSLYNVTSKLHLLLKHIQEVSSVTVEDVDECEHSALRQCSPLADCNNTLGSYQCACHQGFTDVDPSNPGALCTVDGTPQPPLNTTYTPADHTTQDCQSDSATGLFNSTETSMTTALSNTASVPHNSSHGPSSAAYTSASSTVELPLPTTPCSLPRISNLQSANVTGTSFCVYWSSQFEMNETYCVAIRKGSEVIFFRETNQTMMEVMRLQPGVLYNVSVTLCACGSQGIPLFVLVRTDAQTFDATTRLTNIQYTDDLQNTSSQAYKNLTMSITEEIMQSLSPEMKAMVESGLVRIEIRGFSPGSVVVNIIIFTPSANQSHSSVSTAVLHSLMNSTKYIVDQNNTSINDFDECALGEDDCSHGATCTNTWASYTCDCQDGFIDSNPQRPGRVCQAISTVSTTLFSDAPVTAQATTTPATATITSIFTINSTYPTTTITDPALTTTALTTPTPVPLTTTNAPTTNTYPLTIPSSDPWTTISAPTITTTPLTTPPNAPTTAAYATTITTTPPMTTHSLPSTTTYTPTITTTPLTTSPNAPTTAAYATTITTTPPMTTHSHPSTTTYTPTITTTPPTTTSNAPTTATYATTVITSHAMTTTSVPSTTIHATTITPAPAMTTQATTITTTPPITTSSVPLTTTYTPAITTITPTTTPSAPTTTTYTPAITTITPTTTPSAPTTTTYTPAITTITQTTTPSVATTTSHAPAVPMTNPITTIAASATNTTSLRKATNVSMLGAVSVECRGATITLTVARDFLLRANIQESALYLGLPECGVNGGNATHVQLIVTWDKCATRLVHNETHYTASVTLFNTMEQYTSSSGIVETPKIRLEVPIMCGYMKSMLISADLNFMGYDMIRDIIMGSGSFQITVQLMNGTQPLPYNYSLSAKEAVIVDVSLNTSSEQIKVVINKCWATSTPNPGDSSHMFLENSCSLNTYAKVLSNGNSSMSRVSVQIFSIVDLNVIYLHCQVQICAQIGSDSCVPDCFQRTARSSRNTIGTAFGSSGPLLKLDEGPFDEEQNIIHLAGFACLGIFLCVGFLVTFICLFYYQRNRIGHYNFNAKPKQENFTYLVFNT